MKRRYRKTGICLLSCAALFALLAMLGLPDKQKIWPNLPLDYAQGAQRLSLEAGNGYGPAASGPKMTLPAGTYRIQWRVEGDGVNAVQLTCSNGASIAPDRLETAPGAYEGEAEFVIEEAAHNFCIQAQFEAGTWMQVNNFRLYSPVYTDHYFTLAAGMALLVLLVYLFERGALTLGRREILVPLALAVLLVSLPALREETVLAHDSQFHMARISNLADSLKSGQMPARVGGYSYNGYGGATSVFYPDLLLIPQALMLLLGASPTYVINALMLEMNALAALCMYAAGKRIFADRTAGACAALLYVCSPFRLSRIYESLMVGQNLAMALLPLFLLGLWEVCLGDKRRWPLLALGATLVFQSHLLTTLMCAGAAALCAVLCAGRLLREKRVRSILLAIAAALLLNLTTLVPMATTYMSGVTSQVMVYPFVELAYSPAQLLGMGGQLGYALLLGAAALACCRAEGETPAARKTLLFLLLLGALCACLSTELFPWRYVQAVFGALLALLQFPWRFLVPATVCLALCGGVGYARLLRGQGVRALFAVLMAALVCAAPVLEQAMAAKGMEFGQSGSPFIVSPEYQFEGTDLEATRSREVIAEGDVQLTEYEKDGTRITVQVKAETDAALAFPLFGFDGYAAALDGERIAWTRGENNRLTVALSAGTQGELRIWFAGKRIWRAADIISLGSALALGAYALRRGRAAKKRGEA